MVACRRPFVRLAKWQSDPVCQVPTIANAYYDRLAGGSTRAYLATAAPLASPAILDPSKWRATDSVPYVVAASAQVTGGNVLSLNFPFDFAPNPITVTYAGGDPLLTFADAVPLCGFTEIGIPQALAK